MLTRVPSLPSVLPKCATRHILSLRPLTCPRPQCVLAGTALVTVGEADRHRDRILRADRCAATQALRKLRRCSVLRSGIVDPLGVEKAKGSRQKGAALRPHRGEVRRHERRAAGCGLSCAAAQRAAASVWCGVGRLWRGVAWWRLARREQREESRERGSERAGQRDHRTASEF